MPEDTHDTGIPTRAIHEAYLELQHAHREYRRARDDPSRPTRPAHASFQDAVLTFYGLLRPHLKRKSGVSQFWAGDVPDYPGREFSSVEAARQYYAQGTGVWRLQKHTGEVPLANGGGGTEAVADGGELSFADLHQKIGLTDTQRIIATVPGDGVIVYQELRAVAGLRQLDSWRTREETTHERGNGFMASETTERTELRHVDVAKLTKAKRLLAEAADKMSLLSHVDIDHEDGAIVNFDQSRDGAEAEYRDAEYDSSPDI